MRLDPDACWDRLGAAGHGVLGTVHADRGVDAVPVVFVVVGGRLVVPVDTVKAKSGRRLRRLENLDADERCVLLVDRYEDDWSRLWWVRIHGRAVEAAPTDATRTALAGAFPAYRQPGAVATTIAITPTAVTGWAASG